MLFSIVNVIFSLIVGALAGYVAGRLMGTYPASTLHNIVLGMVGGFVGLIYATSWNNRMLLDYQQAYLDIMDSDPTTRSYMDFFPPTYREEDLDKTWLTNILKQRKDAYRYYRDYCIVGMVGLYLVCILDAYVDAELYHFDMSPDLSMVVKPALIPVSPTQLPAVGLQCAITF